MDVEEYYMRTDVALLANNIMMDIAFLTMNWKQMLGRPTYILVATQSLVGGNIVKHLSFVNCAIALSIKYKI